MVTFVFLTFFFMYMKMCLTFSVGHFIHYATFMAARSYNSGAYSESIQRQSGQTALASYLGEEGNRFKGIVKPVEGGGTVGPGPQFNDGNYFETSWQQGAMFKFKASLQMMPLISVARTSGNRPIEMTAESWLGREVTYEECVQFMTEGEGSRPWLFDNGC